MMSKKKLTEEEFKPTYLEALSTQSGFPIYTTNPFKGELKPRKGIKERYSKLLNQNHEI